MDSTDFLLSLPELLLPWYAAGHRDLPWRHTRNPYHIWLSEIMLQQTRVEAVKGYYARFLQALPTIQALADCDDESLHKLWEGLGYYSRVRNLKKAAQRIVSDFGGVFPREHKDVLSLPGIGDYTAGAICSICYDAPTPAVDGNVLRLLSRLRNDPRPIDQPALKKEVMQLLSSIYPPQACQFTQALMELGATLCGPNRKPDCSHCPCRQICRSLAAGTQEALPVKTPRKARKQEEKTVFILCCGDQYALEKRPDKGLLASLWQFPNVPGLLTPEQALAQCEAWGLHPRDLQRQVHRNHIFTHIEWKMTGYYLTVNGPQDRFSWFTSQEIRSQAALPTAFRQFFEEIENV